MAAATKNLRGTIVRLIGGVALLAALVLSTGAAAALNPVKVGFVECDSGQCLTGTPEQRVKGATQYVTPQRLGGKFGPRFEEH